MKKYDVAFTGREVGAIGICSRFCFEIEAESEDAARLKIYETHEHLMRVNISEIKA